MNNNNSISEGLENDNKNNILEFSLTKNKINTKNLNENINNKEIPKNEEIINNIISYDNNSKDKSNREDDLDYNKSNNNLKTNNIITPMNLLKTKNHNSNNTPKKLKRIPFVRLTPERINKDKNNISKSTIAQSKNSFLSPIESIVLNDKKEYPTINKKNLINKNNNVINLIEEDSDIINYQENNLNLQEIILENKINVEKKLNENKINLDKNETKLSCVTSKFFLFLKYRKFRSFF